MTDLKEIILKTSSFLTLAEDELSKIEINAPKSKTLKQDIKLKEEADKIRKIKESNTLDSLIIILSQNIATQKITIRKSLINKLINEKSPLLFPIYKKLEIAESNKNEQEIINIKKEFVKFTKEYSENQQPVKDFIINSKVFYNFRDKLKIFNDDIKANEMKPHLIKLLIDEGQIIDNIFRNIKFYTQVHKTIKLILNILIAFTKIN